MLRVLVLFFSLFLLVNVGFAEPMPKQPVELANSWWYTPIDELLYFAGYTRNAKDEIDQIGVWRSDGTELGTFQISANILSYQNNIHLHNEKIDDRVFYTADVHNDGTNELYYADEISGQNTLIKKFNDSPGFRTVWPLKVFNDQLFFTARTDQYGDEPYVSNGFAGSATLLKNIRPDGSSSYVTEMAEFNSLLFFPADNGNPYSGGWDKHNTELWVTDGSEAGTQLFKDIYDDTGPLAVGDDYKQSGPSNLTVLGNRLIFSALDPFHGRELWVSNGTAEGTSLLKDCSPGDNAGNPYDSHPDQFLVHGNKLYFRVRIEQESPTRYEIWQTDGTTAGTVKLWRYTWGESGFGAPEQFAIMNNKLFFVAFHPDYGYEIFFLNLSSPGSEPQLLKNINPAEGGSEPYGLTVVRGSTISKPDRLYFNAKDPNFGRELWASDGTTAGTILIKDFNPGPGDAELEDFYAIGHKLFFREGVLRLWVIDRSDKDGVPDSADRIKPRVKISKPKAAAMVKSRFTVQGTAQDNLAVTTVQCKYPGQKQWQNSTIRRSITLKNGHNQVDWRCQVRMNKKTVRNLRKKGGGVRFQVRASDAVGNKRLARRNFYLRR